jgi:adenylosuccinate synthase
MRNIAIVGAQWGDEGKGKLVDLFCDRYDAVARFQGGPNAGHTVKFGDTCHALHHIPSGVFRPDVKIVIGNGTVLDLEKLLDELDGLEKAGIDLSGRLFISDRAHVILPIMKHLDALQEEAAGTGGKIGTTLRGIGPTYQAKAARIGLRLGEALGADTLEERIENILAGPIGSQARQAGASDPASARSIASEMNSLAEKLRPHIADTALLLNEWIDNGEAILFEGAQGTLLDLDHGSYPFVTSSSTVTGGLCAGLGIAPTLLGGVMGVYKAYTTRVGSGPMPTELEDGPEGFGQKLRDRGHEYGTTTGRPRRCGWFDGMAAWYANRVNRFENACITLLDVLDDFDMIEVCTGYELDGNPIQGFPASAADAERIKPVYESLPGWKQDLTAVRRWEDLPENAIGYLQKIEKVIGTEIGMVGVGPDREQSIIRPGSRLEKRLQR